MNSLRSYQVSVWALVGANLVPLFGVLFLRWSTFEIVFVYWAENVVLGCINVLKMITCNSTDVSLNLADLSGESELGKSAGDRLSKQETALLRHGPKLFLVPFFTVHYGLFCLVHGVFVFALLGNESWLPGGASGGFNSEGRGDLSPQLLIAVAGLAISHLISFFSNYLGKGEYRRTTIVQLMVQPYARIVILHVAILFGAFAIVLLGSPLALLVILVIGKTALDLRLHLRERQRNAGPADDPTIKSDLGSKWT